MSKLTGLILAAVLLASPADVRGQNVVRSPAEATELLRNLKDPGLEPVLRWDWEPGAFDPLAHPVEYDFTWRLRELDRADLPALARARLNLELAFLDAARSRSLDVTNLEYHPGRPDAVHDSRSSDERAATARELYGQLLAEHPDTGELLADLGDLYRLAGQVDSAAVLFRKAMRAPRPPARVFARAADAELALFSAAPDTQGLAVFHEIRRAGFAFFEAPAPEDSLRAARHHAEHAKFRIEQALVEFYADRMAHPETWSTAGVDSVFTLLARVVSPPTRRLLAQAAEMDTGFAEAHGVLGAIVTGQILLPVAARSLLYRTQDVPDDSLALAVWVLARERGEQKLADLKYAAANLNRCEFLEPGRYPVLRREQGRLALLFGDVDGSAGLFRSLLSMFPNNQMYAEELFTVYRLEAAGRKTVGIAPSPASRLEEALATIEGRTKSSAVLALLGWSRAAQAKMEPAAATFEAAVALDSLAWRGQLGLALGALRRLDSPAAEPHLKVVGDQFPLMDDPAKSVYCSVVGLLYWARNDVTNAGHWFKEAVVFDPRNETARRALGVLNPKQEN